MMPMQISPRAPNRIGELDEISSNSIGEWESENKAAACLQMLLLASTRFHTWQDGGNISLRFAEVKAWR